ncbi:MAG: glycine cleavage system protein GcvH [wastewater metagenome]|nr:glycine cleavage system protein GcvH [Candidatus Loosdrechtia aerotolerans]
MIPEHLKYAQTHEWYFHDNKLVTIGLTRFVIEKLDKLLFLDLPKIGEEILAGISFGELESLNTLVDITSPISGEVVAVNERLYENLDILNRDPYKQGWLIKFATPEITFLDQLMSAQEYKTYINKHESSIPKYHARGKRRK